MGRAHRWLLNLMGAGSNTNKQKKDHHSGCAGEEVEKKRWSFWKSRTTTGEGSSSCEKASTAAAIEAAWFESFYAASEREQSKHAIAVAEATAVAADAAVMAARAAAAAASISSRRRVCGAQERWAAVKIQTAYRGHLARKALRALKALVKIQALVRGFLVRKQADAALHSMQALIRAQATVRARSHRNLLAFDSSFRPQVPHRRSLERLSDARSEHTAAEAFQSLRLSANLDRTTKIIEIDTCRPRSRSSRRTSPSAPSAADDRSPVRYRAPAGNAVQGGRRNFLPENESWCFGGGRLPTTAQLATPRCTYSSCGGSAAATPARSLSGSSSPNYMTDTRSSKAKAKARSQGTRKRQPLSELNVQKPRIQSQEGLGCNKAGGGRRVESSSESDVYLQRNW